MTSKIILYRFLWALLLIAALGGRLATAVYWEHRFCSPSDSEPSDSTIAANSDDSTVSSDSVETTSTNSSKPIFFFGDSDSYWTLGRNLAFGRAYRHGKENWEIFRTPGYPTLLAPLFWLGGENPPVFWARVENSIFGAINVLLVGYLAFLLFRDRRIALLAGLFVAFEPCSVVQSVTVLAEEPFVVSMLLQLICFVGVGKKILNDVSDESEFAPARFCVQGLFLGAISAVAVYFRPSWFYFLPFGFFFLFVHLAIVVVRKKVGGASSDLAKPGFADFELTNAVSSVSNRSEIDVSAEVLTETSTKSSTEQILTNSALTKRRNRAIEKTFASSWGRFVVLAAAATVAFWATLTPWIVRNERLTGRFIPTTLQAGASLFDGLNPNADGSSDMSFVETFRQAELKSPTGDPSEHFEVRLDRRLKRASIDWIRENPRKVVDLAVVKFFRLWNIVPNEPAFSALPVRIALSATFAPLLICALIGVGKTLERGFEVWLLWLPAVYITLLHIVFVSSIRYRTPATFGLAILAAFAIVGQIRRFRSRKRLE